MPSRWDWWVTLALGSVPAGMLASVQRATCSRHSAWALSDTFTPHVRSSSSSQSFPFPPCFRFWRSGRRNRLRTRPRPHRNRGSFGEESGNPYRTLGFPHDYVRGSHNLLASRQWSDACDNWRSDLKRSPSAVIPLDVSGGNRTPARHGNNRAVGWQVRRRPRQKRHLVVWVSFSSTTNSTLCLHSGALV